MHRPFSPEFLPAAAAHADPIEIAENCGMPTEIPTWRSFPAWLRCSRTRHFSRECGLPRELRAGKPCHIEARPRRGPRPLIRPLAPVGALNPAEKPGEPTRYLARQRSVPVPLEEDRGIQRPHIQRVLAPWIRSDAGRPRENGGAAQRHQHARTHE